MKRIGIAILVTILLSLATFFGIQYYSNQVQQPADNPVTIQTIAPEKARISYDLSYAIHIEKDSLELHLDNIQIRLHMDSLRPVSYTHLTLPTN